MKTSTARRKPDTSIIRTGNPFRQRWLAIIAVPMDNFAAGGRVLRWPVTARTRRRARKAAKRDLDLIQHVIAYALYERD